MPFSRFFAKFSRFFWSIRFFVLSLHPKQYRGIIRCFSMLCRSCFVLALPAIREARAVMFQNRIESPAVSCVKLAGVAFYFTLQR